MFNVTVLKKRNPSPKLDLPQRPTLASIHEDNGTNDKKPQVKPGRRRSNSLFSRLIESLSLNNLSKLDNGIEETGERPEPSIETTSDPTVCVKEGPINVGKVIGKSQDGNDSEDFGCHDNSLFRSDANEDFSRRNVIKVFGKKGKDVGNFEDATNIMTLSEDRMLVTDLVNSRIQLCNKDGKPVMIYQGEEVGEPWATATTREGFIAVTSQRQKIVTVLNAEGDVIMSFGDKFFEKPSGIAISKNDEFVVADEAADKVSMHDADGKFIRYLWSDNNNTGAAFASPRYVCCAENGNIIVSDSRNHCIKIFDSQGRFIRATGRYGRSDGQFKSPYGICLTPSSDILVADHYNNRVVMLSSSGEFLSNIATTANGIVHPKGICLTSTQQLCVTHGHLKANEVIVFRLTCSRYYSDARTLSHV